MTTGQKSFVFGTCVAALVLVLAGIASNASEARFTVQDAMAVVQAIGVVFGVPFAIFNLQEIRLAREAETEPLLHATLREIEMNGSRGHAIEIHNLGRGGVVGASIRCWARMEFTQNEFTDLEERPITLNSCTISPNRTSEGSLYLPTYEFALQSDLLVEVT